MALARLSSARIAPDEYLAGESASGLRHEFVDGLVFAMAGASEGHGILKLALAVWLHGRIPAGCNLFDGDMKLKVESASDVRFYYPDLVISSGPRDLKQHVRSDAVMIIEILSPSTERHDRYEKLAAYKSLPSLIEYILVDQSMPSIEVYRRSANWARESYGPQDDVRFDSIKATQAVAAIYGDMFG